MQNINTLIHDMIIERVTPIAEIVSKLQSGELQGLDKDAVEAIVRTVSAEIEKERAEKEPQKILVQLMSENELLGELGNDEHIHAQMPLVLACLTAMKKPINRNAVAWGEAGTGKSYMCKQIAEILKVDYYMQGAALTKYDLLGVQLPSGKVIETGFMKAWRWR